MSTSESDPYFVDPTGREHLLAEEVITIGRGVENDIVITSRRVSREHARVRREGRRFWPYHFIRWSALSVVLVAALVLMAAAPPILSAAPIAMIATRGSRRRRIGGGQGGAGCMARTASPEGARVFFMNPSDGETDSNPMTMVSGIEGMTVVPAGNDTAHSGHHHLLIDTGLADPGL